MKIQSFTDLEVWKEGHRLVLMNYTITKSFPKEEVFGLSSQMRRAAVSITSNIAEGFGRKSKKEKIQFYSFSEGSLTEIQNQLIIARDIKYITREKFEEIFVQSTLVYKLLRGLMKSIRSRTP